MTMKIIKMKIKMILTIISSKDIEGYQDSFCFKFFFNERYFKYKKHKQKHFK